MELPVCQVDDVQHRSEPVPVHVGASISRFGLNLRGAHHQYQKELLTSRQNHGGLDDFEQMLECMERVSAAAAAAAAVYSGAGQRQRGGCGTASRVGCETEFKILKCYCIRLKNRYKRC